MLAFKHVFSPIKLGPTEIKNRIFITAHATGFAEPLDFNRGVFRPSENHAAYYEERAKGGVGLIVMEAGIVHYSSEGIVVSHLYDPRVVDGLRVISERVHRHGTKMFCQLYHGGHHASNMRSGLAPVSSSQIPSPRNSYVIPAAMTKDDIREVVNGFATSAKHAMEGGFDGVEIHGTHGYLVEQFLSPHFNRRTDEYGGSLEGRSRFLFEVVAAVRKAVGEKLAVGCRFMADEMLGDGLALGETTRVAQMLEDSGKLDFLDVDIGMSGRQHHFQIAPLYVNPGHEIEYIAAVKHAVSKIPVLGCPGRCGDPTLAESLIASGKMDMVAMTRAHIADPEIVNKTLEQRLEDIRPCIGTNEHCYNRLSNGSPIRCNVNPTAGREREWGIDTLKPASKKKKVLVVGAGPAGLEAARVAAIRGHKVVIYEKGEEIGGQVRFAKKLPGRFDVAAIIGWYETQLKKLGVDIRFRAEITGEPELMDYIVKEEKPDAVIVATGSTYDSKGFTEFTGSGIPGVETAKIATPVDILSGREVGAKAVILDDEGFETAPSLAEFLLSRGCKVELVTRFYMFCSAIISTLQLPFIYERLYKNGVSTHTSSFVDRIDGRTVTIYNVYTGEKRTIDEVDTFVPVTSKASVSSLYNTFKARVRETYLIGDATAPRRIHHAIVDGYALASGL